MVGKFSSRFAIRQPAAAVGGCLVAVTLLGCSTIQRQDATPVQSTSSPAVASTPTLLELDSRLAQVAYQSEQLSAPLQAESEHMVESTEMVEPAGMEGEANTWSVEELTALALATHPEIAAARQKVAAVTNRIPQARALPDPMFSNTFWPIHDQALQTAAGRIGNQMAVSQQVPWPEKLDARASVAAREVLVARAELARIESEIVEAVRLAYHELWLALESIRIVEDNRDLVRDLVTVAEARYRAGGSQQDVLRAESEADKLEDQLIQLRQRMEQARADLGALVGKPMSMMPQIAPATQIVSTVPELESLIAELEQNNPTLQGLSAEIARDRAKETVACLQQYPDLQFGLNWSLVSDDDDVISPVANGHDNLSFVVGVTLPVWRDKIDAGIREAALARNSTAYRRQAAEDRLKGQLRRQLAAAYAAIEQRNLLQDRLIPRTEQTLTIATADYQGKRTDFFNLIDAYQELLQYQVQLARTRATLANILVQIAQLTGDR